MIFVGTLINVIDKSSAKKALIICILKNLKIADIGDKIIVVIKKAIKKKTKKKLAQKGKIYQAIIVKKKIIKQKISGLKINFLNKAIILLKKDENEPFSTRLNGSVSINSRKKGFLKVLSMASYII